MPHEIWLNMSACDLGRGIEAGRIDPRALTETFLSAIRHHPQAASIYARLTEKRAMEEAAAAAQRARSGLRESPLDGVPVSWKDLFDSANVATEAGSALLAGRVPKRDAEVLRRCRMLGLICLGKTHLSELAFSGLGLNPMTATTPCVHDVDKVAGGSSSGAAASVAFDLAAAAIGSDTGGSVRIPAAWNDLVGLKTTSGTLPLEGVVPLCPKFDTVGPLTRTVEDAAVLFVALSGQSRMPFVAGEALRDLRLLIAEDCLEQVDRQPSSAFDAAVSRLQAAGAEVTSTSLGMVNDALSLAPCLYTAEAYSQWNDLITAAPEKMFENIRDRFLSGRSFTAAEYLESWDRLVQSRREFDRVTVGYDVVMVPTCPNMPPKREDLMRDEGYYVEQNRLALSHTRIANLMDIPALTIPTGVASTGLMLLGHRHDEIRLLRIGYAVETILSNRD